MAGVKNAKLKLLVLSDILSRETDEAHPLNAAQLCDRLARAGQSAERKSIYKDIEILREHGLDIIRTPEHGGGYFLGERAFQLAEIRLLSDAVLSANFISAKKTKELIKKIESFASLYQAKILHDQVYVDNRPKCTNEELYYTISHLDEAITAQTKVRFFYQRRHITEGFHTVREDREFTVSPYALIWSQDHYYLVCNNEKYNNLMHVRIDRIHHLEQTDEQARHFSEVSKYRNRFDSADYAAKLFGMFSGEQKPTELICDNTLLEQMLDRFGDTVRLQKYDETHFLLHTDAVIGEGLVTWVTQFGGKIKVKMPNELKELVTKRAKEILAANEESAAYRTQ